MSLHLWNTSKFLRLSEDLPIIGEIVDEGSEIYTFLPARDGMLGSGLVTLATVRARHSRHGVKEGEE